MALTTLGFRVNYRVQRVNGPVPSDLREFRRSGGTGPPTQLALQAGTKDVVLVVEPANGKSWYGRFWGGAEGLDGVFATPSPEVLCVIVRGQGYWVPVHDPTAFETIRSVPIKRVLPINERGILIFASYTRLSAYSATGFMWVTDELSWDGLNNLEVTGGTVRGIAWDSPAGRDVPFEVDVATGEAEGGSSPAKYGASR